MKTVQQFLESAGTMPDEELTRHILQLKLVTTMGDPVVITHIISLSGGQGVVFRAECKGKKYALKWYKNEADCIGSQFYENIQKLISRGNPKPGLFIWPLCIVTSSDSGEKRFGYLMDEFNSDKYKELDRYLMATDKADAVSFPSYRANVTAGIEMARAMEILHNHGLSYKDLNPNNFAINIDNGHVLVIDNDNVSVDKYDIAVQDGVKGFPGCMAPEIPRSGYRKSPTIETDRYSLAVCLFRLFFVNHPMDGALFEVPPMVDEKVEEELYYFHPVFSMHPSDTSNRPTENVGADIPIRWNFFPKSVRDLFIKSFTEGIDHPRSRVTENIWEKTLSEARSILVRKTNGAERFVDFEKKDKIPAGTLKMTISRGEMQNAAVAAILPGSGIYKFTITGVADDLDKPMMGFGVDNGWMAAKNMDPSQATWKIAYPNNQPNQPYNIKEWPYGTSMVVYPGVQILFDSNPQRKIVGVFTDARK